MTTAASNPSSPLAHLWVTLNRVPWSLGFAAGMIIYFAPHSEWHNDLTVYRLSPDSLRYLPWSRWILSPLRVLPELAAYVLLSLAATALLYAAVRIFSGRHWMVFTTFAYGWTLFYGQVDGLVVGGLALTWWAMCHDQPFWMGLGFLLACMKPQVGLPLTIAIWWWSSNKIKPLIIPLLVTGLTFLVWGWWVPGWINNILHASDLTGLTRNVSWWQVLGPWCLLIWLVIIPIRLPRPRKAIAIAAATAFSMPYFPAPSSLLFLVMPIPAWSYLFAQLPLLSSFVGFWIYDWLKILPTILVLWAIWPAISPLVQGVKTILTRQSI